MNPSTTYFDQFVLSADPVTLVRLLLQKASSYVVEARGFLKAGEIARRGAAIMNAYEILLELQSALHDDQAPEFTSRLRALYAYMQERLITANLKQIEEPLAEVEKLLGTLIEGWTPTVQKVHVEAATYPQIHDSSVLPQVYAA